MAGPRCGDVLSAERGTRSTPCRIGPRGVTGIPGVGTSPGSGLWFSYTGPMESLFAGDAAAEWVERLLDADDPGIVAHTLAAVVAAPRSRPVEAALREVGLAAAVLALSAGDGGQGLPHGPATWVERRKSAFGSGLAPLARRVVRRLLDDVAADAGGDDGAEVWPGQVREAAALFGIEGSTSPLAPPVPTPAAPPPAAPARPRRRRGPGGISPPEVEPAVQRQVGAATPDGAGLNGGHDSPQQLSFTISWETDEAAPAQPPVRAPRRRSAKRGATPEQLRWDALFE